MKVSVDSSLVKADVDVDVESVKKVGSFLKGKLLGGMNKLTETLNKEPGVTRGHALHADLVKCGVDMTGIDPTVLDPKEVYTFVSSLLAANMHVEVIRSGIIGFTKPTTEEAKPNES